MRIAIEQEVAELMRTSGEEPKGLLCNEIFVPAVAMDDESGGDLVYAVVEFTNWAMNDAQFMPGEFPLEALCAYYADYYLAQVNNGGHAQWACNSGFQPLTVKAAGWGLEAMGAHDYLAIHQEFVRLMSDPGFAEKILSSDSGFGGRYQEEEALNSRFYALDPNSSYPMLKMSAAWLKSLPHLKPLQPEPLEAARAAAIAAHPHHEARLAKAKAAQEASFFSWAPRKLCSLAKVEFIGLTAGNAIMAEGKRRFAWFMQTSDGLHAMAMIGPSLLSGPKAKLYRVLEGMDPAGSFRALGRPLAEAPISKQDYEGHAPPRF